MLFLDTHAAVFLYLKREDTFSPDGLRLIEENDLCISPMVAVELEYLFETDRVSVGAATILEYLNRTVGLAVDQTPFMKVAERAFRLKWTRDPFDRLITAQADFADAPLLTRDRRIQTYYVNAVW